MSTNPSHESNEEIAKEILKPMEEVLAEEEKELKKAEELIREAERKSKPVLDPEP